jgi:hypothetical protein
MAMVAQQNPRLVYAEAVERRAIHSGTEPANPRRPPLPAMVWAHENQARFAANITALV